MAGKADISYNSRAGRWEVRGQAGKLIRAFTNDSTAIGKVIAFGGTSAAVSIGSLESAIGSISGGANINLGDTVIATPRILVGSMGYSIRVPSSGLINVVYTNPKNIAATYPVTGWDVVAIRRAY